MFTAQIRFDNTPLTLVKVEDPTYKMPTHLEPGHIS